MTTLLIIISSVLGGGLVAVVGVLVWLEDRGSRAVGPVEVDEDPPGLAEDTLPGPIPPRDYLEEVTRDPPVLVPDNPDDPHADERRVDGSRAVLDEWERVRDSLDGDL